MIFVTKLIKQDKISQKLKEDEFNESCSKKN